MSPEYGATCGFFPVDEATLDYLRMTGRPPERIALVEAYCKEQGLFHDPDEEPTYSEVLELDLGDVEPSLAGPRRPQDRVPLSDAKNSFLASLESFGVDYNDSGHDEALAETFPASDPTVEQQPGRTTARTEPDEPVARCRRRSWPSARSRCTSAYDGRGVRARARRGRDRRDHELHEHVQPGRDARRRACSPGTRSSAGSSASRG